MTGPDKDLIAKAAREGEIARANKAREIAWVLRRVDKIGQDHINALSNLEGQWPVFLDTLRYSRLERWCRRLSRHQVFSSMVLVARASLLGAYGILVSMFAADIAGWLR